MALNELPKINQEGGKKRVEWRAKLLIVQEHVGTKKIIDLLLLEINQADSQSKKLL